MPAETRGIQLNASAIAHLPRLLPMEYTPGELAAELGCHAHQIRQTALPLGCPHRRDARGRLWIVGSQFRDWYRATQVRRRHPMEDNEAWCLRCKQPQQMVGPFEVTPRHGSAELVKGRCGVCGTKVNRLRTQATRPP